VIRASAPLSIPANMSGRVLMVTGLVQFPSPRFGSMRGLAGDAVAAATNFSDLWTVPQTVLSAYNVTLDGNNASSQAPVELQGLQAYLPSDLQQFQASVGSLSYRISPSHIIVLPGE